MRSPAPALDIRDVQVIKDGRTFFQTNRYGDIPEGNAAALGLYHEDTRFLSRLELTLDRGWPILLHASTEQNYRQIVELAYPMAAVHPSRPEQRDSISIHRSRVLSGSLFERLHVRNYGIRRQDVHLTLEFGADFLDIFEVRGLERARRGQQQPAHVERNLVVLRYRGLDGVSRSTTLRFSPAPETLTESHAAFSFGLDPSEEVEIALEIVPEVGTERTSRRSMRETEDRLAREYTAWQKRCTGLRASHPGFSGLLDRAILDLRMLGAVSEEGWAHVDAGVPWYSALFGRDSLITAYQALAVDPRLAWGTLRELASHQGEKEDDWREEAPGKIPHELRVGEMARAGEIPQTPYYGSVDATPLWLIVLAAAYRWTGDLEAARELWPNAMAALRWIDEFGDADGDGYVEYERRSRAGLDNQGWKDSHDAIVFPDGTLATPPIAPVEVQGYVFQAKRRLRRLARDLGEPDLAERLEKEADQLRERFSRDFWLEKEGYLALALDGDKRPVPTISSNPGHCLWSQIVDPEHVSRVVRRLMSPALSSGWGIRTVASKQGAFDPIGYHRGTVWPHDTALIAHGLKRYGYDRECGSVLDQLVRAGAYFPYARLPELYCGFSAENVPVPVQYPVACRPQAWASGTPLLMVRSYCGLSAYAPDGRLYIVRPTLPRWLERLEILGMRVGTARLDLVFTNHDGVTAVQVPRKEGDLDVLIRQ